MLDNIRKPQSVKQDGSRKFVVVSYAHADSEIVFRELCSLEDQKAAFWYDASNQVGESWYQNITKHLDDDLCVGVIIFVSKTSLISEPCSQELEYIEKIYQNRKLTVICVLIDDDGATNSFTLNNIIAKAKMQIWQDPSTALEKDKIIEKNVALINLFTKNNEVIYGRTCKISNCEKCEQKCDYQDSLIKKLKSLKALSNIEHAADDLEKDDLNNHLVIQDTYKRKPIKWINVEKEGNVYTFVCNQSLEYCDIDNINQVLENVSDNLHIFKNIHDDWDRVQSEPVRLLTKEEYLEAKTRIAKYRIKQDILQIDSENILQDYWWIQNGRNKTFVLADGSIATNKLYEKEKLGIRPVIVLKYEGRE